MKVGSENRTKLYIAIALFCLAVFFVYRWISGPSQPASAQTPAPTTATTAQKQAPAPVRNRGNRKNAPVVITSSIDPTLRTDLLKSSEEANYEGKGRNIFRAEAEPPAEMPKPVIPVVTTPPPPTGPPPPPPINLKFYGFANNSGQGQKRVFLSQGEDIFVAGEGDVVKSRYKVLRINPTSVEIEDLLSNNKQSIPLTAS